MDQQTDTLTLNKGLQAVCMTQRVIDELEQQIRRSRESLEGVLEPEIERLDALQRASERLLPEDPERWQGLAALYGELGDLLRAQATEVEAEMVTNTELIAALREDLLELQALAYRARRDGSGTRRPREQCAVDMLS
jgi:predicted PilT family ATPase